jgi:hypothetical protein
MAHRSESDESCAHVSPNTAETRSVPQRLTGMTFVRGASRRDGVETARRLLSGRRQTMNVTIRRGSAQAWIERLAHPLLLVGAFREPGFVDTAASRARKPQRGYSSGSSDR